MAFQRLFIAFPLSEALRENCLALQDRGRRQGLSLRWSRPEQLHLTLVFLGKIAPEIFETVAAALRFSAARYPPFALRFSGLGVFPNLRRPRVLWAGVSEAPALMALQQDLSASMIRIGIPLDARPFRPHLSLGRFRSGASDEARGRAGLLNHWMQSEADVNLGCCEMSTLLLMESRLRPQGPQYPVRLRAPLGADAPQEI